MVITCGADLLRRVLCLLLIVMLAWAMIGLPAAHAVVLETAVAVYGAEIILGVLAAAGVVFASSDDGRKVSTAIWSKIESAKSAAWETLQSIATKIVNQQVDYTKASIRVSEGLYNEIISAFESDYSDGYYTLDAVTSYVVSDETTANALRIYLRDNIVSSVKFATADAVGRISAVIHKGYVQQCIALDGGTVKYVNTCIPAEEANNPCLVCSVGSSYVTVMVQPKPGAAGAGYSLNYPVTIDIGVNIPIPAPDLAYPSDDLLVRAPDLPVVDEITGAATWPADAAYTRDAVTAPYPTTEDGTKVPDIPYDVPIDTSTGKLLDDTDVDNPDTPSTDEDTKTDVKWPSAGDLSLPQLIIGKFPFCIPFDVARMIGMLDADPKAPVFVVPLKYGTILDEEITLDLSKWDDVIKIVRWGELICFVAALAAVTRNYIKW